MTRSILPGMKLVSLTSWDNFALWCFITNYRTLSYSEEQGHVLSAALSRAVGGVESRSQTRSFMEELDCLPISHGDSHMQL